MDANTLRAAMGAKLSLDRYSALLGDFNAALVAAQCTTVNRVAMFCAQVGHESLGLFYMEELASGAAYEGRKDLGNTQPGDGKRFKGRGPIQLTGRTNYGAFGAWAKSQGLVGDSAYFVNNPTAVAIPRWGFLAAAWYWTVARTKLSAYADAGDVTAATKAINGGTNGLADRQARWNTCLRLGNALLPSGAAPPSSGRRTLRRGDSGADVRDLQTVLARWYPTLHVAVDGEFGPGTEAAVRELQTRAHLTVDGIAGAATFRALGMT